MKFGNLYAIPSRNGLTKPRSVRGDGIKFVNMGELFENERIGNIEMDRVPVSKTEMRDALLQKDDLLFARQSLVREGAGKCSIITEVEEPTTFDSHLIRVRLNRSIANPSFYRYYFASPLSPMPGIVSQCAQAGIKGSDLKNLDVDCPPIEVQDKIASILGAYDELVENNRKQIRLLEEAVQRFYREWFIDLKFPGHETAPVVDGLPEGWKYGILGDLLDECGTRIDVHEREAFEHYLPIDSLPSKSFTCWDSRPICEAESSLLSFKKDDFIFGAMRPYFHKVVVAPYEGITRSTCFVLCSKDAIANYFAYMSLFWEQTIRYATSISVGTTMPYVRWNDLKRMKLIIPRQSVQRSFSSLVASFFNEILVLEKHVALAREARDRLLPKLMSGEIEV